MPAFPIVPSF